MSKFKVKPFTLEFSPGHKICQISMRANGVDFGTNEGDEVIQREIDIQAKSGWDLVALMTSEGKERVNLKFSDGKKRAFSCQLKGAITGELSVKKLIDKLQKIGIIAHVSNFDVWIEEAID